jgi:hypothetical protein
VRVGHAASYQRADFPRLLCVYGVVARWGVVGLEDQEAESSELGKER